jgi:hypothetical protein
MALSKAQASFFSKGNKAGKPSDANKDKTAKPFQSKGPKKGTGKR